MAGSQSIEQGYAILYQSLARKTVEDRNAKKHISASVGEGAQPVIPPKMSNATPQQCAVPFSREKSPLDMSFEKMRIYAEDLEQEQP
jgi:hypothetical protein